jgi:hypothetical protein
MTQHGDWTEPIGWIQVLEAERVGWATCVGVRARCGMAPRFGRYRLGFALPVGVAVAALAGGATLAVTGTPTRSAA